MFCAACQAPLFHARPFNPHLKQDPARDVFVTWCGEDWCWDCLWAELHWVEGEEELKTCAVCGWVYSPRTWAQLLPPNGSTGRFGCLELRQCVCNNTLALEVTGEQREAS